MTPERLTGCLVAQDAAVEHLEDVAVDDLDAALGFGRIGLGRFALLELLDLVDGGDEVLVLGVDLAGGRVERGQVDAGLGQEVLVGDELVELLDQLGLVGGRRRA